MTTLGAGDPDHDRSRRSLPELIARRAMCRDYLDTAVDPAALDRVLSAAFAAPRAGNTAALDLLVLEGGQVERYWAATLPAPRRDAFAWPGLLRAPVLVVPYVDPVAYLTRYSERDKADSGLGADLGAWPVPYWFVDGGAAVMAMLLQAEHEDLGALLFGQFSHEAAVRVEFGVPADRRALGTVALGHPAPGGRRRSRSARRGRPDPEERTHHGAW